MFRGVNSTSEWSPDKDYSWDTEFIVGNIPVVSGIRELNENITGHSESIDT